MKKLVNAPDTVVSDALSGMAIAHRHLSIDLEQRLVIRGDAPVDGKVGILSGGGSGAERRSSLAIGTHANPASAPSRPPPSGLDAEVHVAPNRA